MRCENCGRERDDVVQGVCHKCFWSRLGDRRPCKRLDNPTTGEVRFEFLAWEASDILGKPLKDIR